MSPTRPIHIPLPDGRIALVRVEIRASLDTTPLDAQPPVREATLAEGIDVLRRLSRTALGEISNPSDLES